MRVRSCLVVLVAAMVLVAASPVGHAALIVWVTENTDASNPPSPDDVRFAQMLTAYGHTVDRRNMTSLDAAKIAEMEAADLVIVSRDTNSGNYTQGTEVADWNGITTPLMQVGQYLVRNSRWRWLDTGGNPGTGDGVLEVIDTAHPIFANVALGAGNTVDIAISTTPASGPPNVGNGQLLAGDPDNNNITIAYWTAGTEFYPGSGQIAGGDRMFFGAGIDGNDPKGALNLTNPGEQIFRDAVDFLTGAPAIVQPTPLTADSFQQVRITSEADILNDGTLIAARSFGATSGVGAAQAATLNGIPLDAVPGNDPNPGAEANFSPYIYNDTFDTFDASTVFPDGSELDKALSGILVLNNTAGVTSTELRLMGLDPMHLYRLQWLSCSDSQGRGIEFTDTYDGNVANVLSVTGLLDQVGATNTIIEFVADSSIQHIYARGVNDDTVLNAYILHDLGQIPEPASLLLVGAGLLGLARRRRRR